MENIIGRKVRGFKLDEGYNNKMDKHIGEVGKIVYVDGNYIQVNFGNETWSYPLDQIKEHLVDEVPTHYDNTNGSIYKFCNDQKLNAWEFDIIKRIVRSRKKGMFKEDLEKTKVLIDLYLKEFDNE